MLIKTLLFWNNLLLSQQTFVQDDFRHVYPLFASENALILKKSNPKNHIFFNIYLFLCHLKYCYVEILFFK